MYLIASFYFTCVIFSIQILLCVYCEYYNSPRFFQHLHLVAPNAVWYVWMVHITTTFPKMLCGGQVFVNWLLSSVSCKTTSPTSHICSFTSTNTEVILLMNSLNMCWELLWCLKLKRNDLYIKFQLKCVFQSTSTKMHWRTCWSP